MPSPTPVAERFLAAWNSKAADTMVSLFDRRARRRWGERRLHRFFGRTDRHGELVSLEVRSAGPVEWSDGRSVAEAPYELVYDSKPTGPGHALQGRLDLERDDDAWRVSWSKRLMWPGIEGARDITVAYRWPLRAPIFDRRGDPLARGRAGERRYPFGALGGNIVGHVGEVARADIVEDRRVVGASGLEAAFDDRLAGRPAARLMVVSARGRPVEVLARRGMRRGRAVRSTIDVDIQRATQEAYGATVGGVVVLDPRRGDLLAAVSNPGFDPGKYAGSPGVDPFDRALSGRYPPGSSMKVVTASAALDSGVVTPSTRLTGPREYKGVRNFESGAFGRIDFASAVRFSVNTAFAQVAERLGGKRLTHYATGFGFNRTPAIALPAATSSFPRPRDLYDLMWGSIGQAEVLATPLEMASVAATIANNGRRMEPRSTFLEPAGGKRVVTRSTSSKMNVLMQGVVNDGTGVRASVPGVAVAGKTGTAEVDVDGRRRNHAWFVCFAPAGAPKVAVAVVAELGGVGGEVAAPLAGAILQRVLPLVS